MLGLETSARTDTLPEASNLIDVFYTRGEIQNKQQYRNSLDQFCTNQMELASKISEQIAFNTKAKIEGHILIAIDKSTQKEHQSQPLRNYNKQI